MSGFLIATGADHVYFPLVQELLASVRHTAPGETIDFGVIDGGLTGAQRDWLTGAGGARRHADTSSGGGERGAQTTGAGG